MKVTLKEWNAVATWHWDIPEDEVCGICRVQFDGTCPTCKFPGDDCSLLLGKCGHSFHMVRLAPLSPLWDCADEIDFFRIALPFNLDPTRILQGVMSNVPTKIRMEAN
ncbi:hypothetical protein N7481_008697 [Penicillium waksmanii]|uniref:uncharacterized protein n=1 Tax=Penicillium waksmanii TaxID=69791 RepID=UPI0025483160|nr:uncharacterized protein N7481_008697 [Penicillium waksmanii]KAJ5974990.1 hypothetical protein N7481_008697 [Penicillium waksmanii]